MKVLQYQMRVIAGSPVQNRQRVEEWMREEVKKYAPDVVVLPEMWTTGYALEQLEDIAEQEGGVTESFLMEQAKTHNVMIVAGSMAVKTADGIVNRSLVYDHTGTCVHRYDKIHLVPMLNEPDYLVRGQEKPTVFPVSSSRAGVLICYDLRFPELFRSLALQGAEVIFVVGEWPAARRDHWDTLLKARAIENQCYIVACDAVGSHNDVDYSGNSLVYSPWGNLIVRASPVDEETVVADLDFSEVQQFRKAVPNLTNRVPSLY
ncbi:carbon-nitrogen family hydrolase [Geomicrobium sp. JCM 19039]|uniref:carbon-nitrogen family hydrolase n=1 Tax=Geomicrobium sp. JCM 19039 TaxID=1460636 RepID=UPI00045F14C1|nr:carbon-nitrogen family hydrolase [Geomicrobium sp. JCM 19039]GAK11054.1 aliphatic amidase AmiE [Geomicrobium sp. JCM 19039]